jgi:hypothetical protein
MPDKFSYKIKMLRMQLRISQKNLAKESWVRFIIKTLWGNSGLVVKIHKGTTGTIHFITTPAWNAKT